MSPLATPEEEAYFRLDSIRDQLEIDTSATLLALLRHQLVTHYRDPVETLIILDNSLKALKSEPNPKSAKLLRKTLQYVLTREDTTTERTPRSLADALEERIEPSHLTTKIRGNPSLAPSQTTMTPLNAGSKDEPLSERTYENLEKKKSYKPKR